MFPEEQVLITKGRFQQRLRQIEAANSSNAAANADNADNAANAAAAAAAAGTRLSASTPNLLAAGEDSNESSLSAGVTLTSSATTSIFTLSSEVDSSTVHEDDVRGVFDANLAQISRKASPQVIGEHGDVSTKVVGAVNPAVAHSSFPAPDPSSQPGSSGKSPSIASPQVPHEECRAGGVDDPLDAREKQASVDGHAAVRDDGLHRVTDSPHSEQVGQHAPEVDQHYQQPAQQHGPDVAPHDLPVDRPNHPPLFTAPVCRDDLVGGGADEHRLQQTTRSGGHVSTEESVSALLNLVHTNSNAIPTGSSNGTHRRNDRGVKLIVTIGFMGSFIHSFIQSFIHSPLYWAPRC